MKQRFIVVFSVAVSLLAPSLAADEPLCATGERADQILAYLQERREHAPHDENRARIEAAAATPTAHDGMFFLQVDPSVAPFGHANDLVGQTLEFTPSDATHYALRHPGLSYIEPATAPLRDFSKVPTPAYVKYDLQSTPLTLFGNSVTSLYLSEYNGIHLSVPPSYTAYQIDDLHAFAQANPVISPLLLTTGKPSRLAFPKLYVEERDGSVVVTWRSDTGSVFGYDIQAQLFTDGRIRFTYRSSRAMRWGAPVISAGITPAFRSTAVASWADNPNDAQTPTIAALKGMVDIQNVEVARINDSDILRVRIKVASPIDPSKLAAGDILRYLVVFGSTGTQWFDIRQDGSTQFAPIAQNFFEGDPGASYSGDTVTMYFSQPALPITSGTTTVSAISRVGASKTYDSTQSTISLPQAPHGIARDLSGLADGTSLELPITEPFTLPTFDPAAAWLEVKAKFPTITDNDVDAIAFYQSFYTDLIFYAGAYSANGNAGADGIAPAGTSVGSAFPKRTNVLHMNTIGYGWNSTDQLSGHVIMHEFGHRWLYFLKIKEGNTVTNSLNPISSHPAQYIHTPAAFRVYNDYDASVMGGGVFTPSDTGFHVRDANYGYSWTDLYLMGLATPNEVPPWFYVANTNPPLGLAYYPPDDIDVTGNRVDVNIQQVIDGIGPRNPSMANSPKTFKVLFALVTDEGVEPTAEEIAAMNKTRQIFEEKFKIATGGRAEVKTGLALAGPRRRGVSH